MKQVKGWWLPDTDTDFDRWISNGEYQKVQRDTILEFLKKQGIPVLMLELTLVFG